MTTATKEAEAYYGMFELTRLEDDSIEIIGGLEMAAALAPQLKTIEERNEWLEAFTATAVLQKMANVKIEVIDPTVAFASQFEEYKLADAEAKAAKKALYGTLLHVLMNLLEEDLAEGAIHKTSDSKTAKTTYGIVEKYVLQAGAKTEALLANAGEFPAFVVAELQRIHDVRSTAAAKREAAKAAKN